MTTIGQMRLERLSFAILLILTKSEVLIRISVLVIAAFVFLKNIDSFPLRNWDEAWYAQITRNMASGQYSLLVPFWNGEYFFDKPPLYFWLSLPFFEIFSPPAGGGEWQARIIAAISAIAATFFVYLIGRRLFGSRAAFLAVLIFLTLGQVVIRFAHGNLDALVVCLILATFYFYLVANRFWPVAGVCLALTYLAKGWVLGLVPILLVVLFEYFLLGKNFKRVLLVVGVSIFLVIPYYISGYLNFDQQFISWYLFNPTASLFSLEVFSWQFFANLARDVGFWLVPFVLSLAVAFKIKREDGLKLFVLGFCALIFLFSISFLSGKLGWYALSVYPFISLILAYFIDKLFKIRLSVAVVLVMIVIGLQIKNVMRIENIHPDRSLVGANLGRASKEIVPASDYLILDDRDLPAFLFYSEHKKVFVLSESRQDWEWWILTREGFSKLLLSGKRVWIITKNSNLVTNAEVVAELEDYEILRIGF